MAANTCTQTNASTASARKLCRLIGQPAPHRASTSCDAQPVRPRTSRNPAAKAQAAARAHEQTLTRARQQAQATQRAAQQAAQAAELKSLTERLEQEIGRFRL